MKILVTGAAGFIGSHTAEKLKTLGHDVLGLDCFSDYYNIELKKLNAQTLLSQDISIKNIDLKNLEDLFALEKDFDFIFHFAAQPGISKDCSFEDYLDNNVIATQNLIQFAKSCNALQLFVNIATSSIYGLEAVLTEDDAPKPASYYGVTKLAAEQLVLAQSREQKLKACSFRLFSVYGPRERPDKLYTRLINSALNKQPFTLYKGSEKHLRSFTYVSDIVDGLISVFDKIAQVNGEVFNLGSEEENTTLEGIQTVERLTHNKIVIKETPPREGDQSRTWANIEKAKRVLQYQPKTSLEEGLKQHISWFEENNIGQYLTAL